MSPIQASKANDKDAMFMMSVLENMEGKPKVDWKAVATAMSLKNAGVATVRFGQIKKKLGWKSGDTATAGASVTSSFSTIDKVTKRKATTTGSARVKRAQKASANGEDAIDDEEESGDVDNKLDAEDEMKDDAADEIKHKDAGQRTTNLLAALKAEMIAEDEASFLAENDV